MKALLLTLLHLTVMTATLCGPGGVRAVRSDQRRGAEKGGMQTSRNGGPRVAAARRGRGGRRHHRGGGAHGRPGAAGSTTGMTRWRAPSQPINDRLAAD